MADLKSPCCQAKLLYFVEDGEVTLIRCQYCNSRWDSEGNSVAYDHDAALQRLRNKLTSSH